MFFFESVPFGTEKRMGNLQKKAFRQALNVIDFVTVNVRTT